MTDKERIELLENFVSLLAASTAKANAVSQTSIQLLIKKNIVTYDEAAEMRKIVESNTETLKALYIAIDLFDYKVNKSRKDNEAAKEIFRKAMNMEISDDEFREYLRNNFEF